MNSSKKAVLSTVVIAVLFIIGASLYQKSSLPEAVTVNTVGQPSVGSGPIEIVIFEDLKCINCRIFGEDVLPQISSNLVDTGRVKLIVIPVSFQEQSKPLANAALSVYETAPHRFIPFILELLHSNASGRDEILKAAKVTGGINMEQLAFCIDHKLYYYQVDRNLDLGQSLMGDEFGTPTLYVNGIMTSTDSFDALNRRIQQIEAQK